MTESVPKEMQEVFYEVLLAPGYEPGALEMLQKKIAEELGFELVDHRLELYARKKQ